MVVFEPARTITVAVLDSSYNCTNSISFMCLYEIAHLFGVGKGGNTSDSTGMDESADCLYTLFGLLVLWKACFGRV